MRVFGRVGQLREIVDAISRSIVPAAQALVRPRVCPRSLRASKIQGMRETNCKLGGRGRSHRGREKEETAFRTHRAEESRPEAQS